MGVETRILVAIEGDIRCQSCGRFVKIGQGETLGFWTERNTFALICKRCEEDKTTMDIVANYKQERV